MDEIIKITKYRVGSSEFPTLEAAEEHIKRTTFDKDIFVRNHDYLNSLNLQYCPAINSEGELCLWVNRYNNSDQGNGWEDLFNSTHLRYVKEEIKMIRSEDFIWKFIDKAEEIFIEVNDLKEIITAIQLHFKIYFGAPTSVDEKEELVLSNLLDALGKLHYSPVYIHD